MVIAQGAFTECRSLKTVILNEGLEVLGINGKVYEDMPGVFENSALERIRLPSTLKRIERRAFMGCGNLKRVLLPEGLEYIGRRCFYSSGLDKITLPPGIKMVGFKAFQDCG